MRLRWQQSSVGSKEQSNNDCPSPAHLVIPEGPNADVIENEIQRQPKYEEKDKTTHLVWHAWHGFAEDEGYSHPHRASHDNSKDRQHGFLGEEWKLQPLASRLRSLIESKSDRCRKNPDFTHRLQIRIWTRCSFRQ